MSKETSESNRQRFAKALSNAGDEYLAQLIQMHGPYEVPGYYANSVIDSCLACHVKWPCMTYNILESRQQSKETCTATRQVSDSGTLTTHYCEEVGPHTTHICARGGRCTFIWED